MTLRNLLDADLAVHRHYQGKTARGGFWREVLTRAPNPYFSPVLLCRLAHHLNTSARPLAILASKLNYFLYGIEIARATEIGPGLYFPHTRGTVIGAATIGRDAVIYHGVTIGASVIDIGFNPHTRPTIGDDVLIGTGATVIGPLRVGNGARIGAHALVIKDVAPDAVVLAPLGQPVTR